MTAIFDYLSFARAKKNKEDLEKTNPKNPVLKQEDEQFLHRVASQDVPAAPLPPSTSQDGGKEDLLKAGVTAGSIALPAVSEAEGEDLSKTPASGLEAAKDSPMTQQRTWASYVPSVPSVSVPSLPSLPKWRSKAAEKAPESLQDKIEPKDESAEKTPESFEPNDESAKKASGSLQEKIEPNVESTEKAHEDVPDAYPMGVKITENVKLDPVKQEQDEKDVSVLLDRLNLSSINNTVFSFSDKSQQLYQDFTIILKDMINGGPEAYHDMEKLMRDNEDHLSQMFKNMPPFVQTLVKSLPTKLGGSLGPEILAAASEKPGADMRSRMAAASKPRPSTKTKNKNKVPSVKGLADEKGAVAGMLKSIVNFLQARFPAFITGTNVIMSLSVFILLFVFWYCHKRGREVRLLKEADAASLNDSSDVESGLDESQTLTPEASTSGLEKEASGNADDREAEVKAAADVLKQPEPAEVPLPDKDDEKTSNADKASCP